MESQTNPICRFPFFESVSCLKGTGGAEMDVHEATRIVYSRIQKLEPENVSKIIGYLLLQDYGDREMIRLAFTPDTFIHSLISKAKSHLGLSVKSPSSTHSSSGPYSLSSGSELSLRFTPYSPAPSRPFSSQEIFPQVSSYWEPQHLRERHRNLNYCASEYVESIGDEYFLNNQVQFLGLDSRMNLLDVVGADNPFLPDSSLDSLYTPMSRQKPSLPEFTLKPCVYYARGYCKHGDNCRFSHSHAMTESRVEILGGDRIELGDEECVFSPGALERIEFDLAQLLRAKQTPISIASLPQHYYERYGRILQADGYLTESQRHRKSGHSLTKLLARMKSIVVIERPHGQHVVVLAEDIPSYSDYRSERSDPGAVSSRQIYLTFPSESTFTEEDVANYFRNYGPVQDVRIPCQQKRMFGFVSFVYPETVRLILSEGNPHFVCGSRVLVKPYKEKARTDRKYNVLPELDPAYHSVAEICDNSQLPRQHLVEEHDLSLEMEKMRFTELHISPKLPVHYSFNNSVDEIKHSQDSFSCLFDVLTGGSTSEDKSRNTINIYNDIEKNHGLNLPENPFASQIASTIQTAI